MAVSISDRNNSGVATVTAASSTTQMRKITRSRRYGRANRQIRGTVPGAAPEVEVLPMAHPNWMMLRSYTRDSSVAKKRLDPGTVPRIWRFARPYRRDLVIFLICVVLDATV